MGEVKCYWCPDLIYNPHLMDRFPMPLCRECYDRFLDESGPSKPTAKDRSAQYLGQIFKLQEAEEVMVNVASFLHDWTEP